MSFRVIQTSRAETEILEEFGQSKLFAWLSLLFPLGPILYALTLYRLGWLPAIILMTACYVPGLIAAWKVMYFYERAGTSRVENIHKATKRAFHTAFVGLLFVFTFVTLLLIGLIDA